MQFWINVIEIGDLCLLELVRYFGLLQLAFGFINSGRQFLLVFVLFVKVLLDPIFFDLERLGLQVIFLLLLVKIGDLHVSFRLLINKTLFKELSTFRNSNQIIFAPKRKTPRKIMLSFYHTSSFQRQLTIQQNHWGNLTQSQILNPWFIDHLKGCSVKY